MQEKGRIFVEEFDLSEEVEEYGWAINTPVFFNATGYKGENISGYFLVYERPFFEGRDNYFIVFYGAREGELSEQKPALEKLMAKSFWHRGNGVRELSSSRISVNFPLRGGPFFPVGLPEIPRKACGNTLLT